MQNTTSVIPKQPQFFLARIIHFFFYAILLGILLVSKLPSSTGPVLILKKNFLAGAESSFRFQDPDLPYTMFKASLARSGTATFLTDRPYDPKDPAVERLQAAQGSLAPLLLNPLPVESQALVFCSKSATAQARMQETGYRPIVILADGKMIAEKMT